MTNLSQTGPPPETQNDLKDRQDRPFYECDNLTDLRSIHTDKDNWIALLKGEVAAYDGLLQGFYMYWPTVDHEDNGGEFILAKDGQSMWRKLT